MVSGLFWGASFRYANLPAENTKFIGVPPLLGLLVPRKEAVPADCVRIFYKVVDVMG